MNTQKFQIGDPVNVRSPKLKRNNLPVMECKYFDSMNIESELHENRTVSLAAGWYYRLAGEFICVHEDHLSPYNPPELADDEYVTQFKTMINWQEQPEKPAQIDGEAD